jgi:hypothetical protein
MGALCETQHCLRCEEGQARAESNAWIRREMLYSVGGGSEYDDGGVFFGVSVGFWEVA